MALQRAENHRTAAHLRTLGVRLASHDSIVDRLFRRDPVFLADPYPVYRELRETAPVLRVEGPEGGPPWLNAWHVFTYADTAVSLRDERLSSRRQMAALPLERFGIDPSTPAARFFWTMQAKTMLTMDAPDHTRLRRLSLKAFTPRIVAAMRDDIQTIVDGLLADPAWQEDAPFDVMVDLASPLPAMIIAQLLGIPQEDWASFKRWSDGIIGFNITQEKLDNFHELGQYLLARIAERRAYGGTDLISGLIAARDQDDALSEDELVAQCVILLVGGHETTTFALGNAVYRLLADSPLWENLPHVSIETAVDELLRFDSPFQSLARRANVDLEVGGQAIAAGDTIWFWIAAANRDPAQFTAPEHIDLTREENRHLSFGLGPHYCLGAALARLELQVALVTLRQRFPDLQLVSDSVVWKRDGAIRGPQSLLVSAS
jgi:pimeloyl-[acyl-carrier protein] synthase